MAPHEEFGREAVDEPNAHDQFWKDMRRVVRWVCGIVAVCIGLAGAFLLWSVIAYPPKMPGVSFHCIGFLLCLLFGSSVMLWIVLKRKDW